MAESAFYFTLYPIRVSFQLSVIIIVAHFSLSLQETHLLGSIGKDRPCEMCKGGCELIQMCNTLLFPFLMPKKTKTITAFLAVLRTFFPPFSHPSSNPFISTVTLSFVSQLALSVHPAVNPAV